MQSIFSYSKRKDLKLVISVPNSKEKQASHAVHSFHAVTEVGIMMLYKIVPCDDY